MASVDKYHIWLVKRPRALALFYSHRFFAEEKLEPHFGPRSVPCDCMDCTQAFAHLNYAYTSNWVLASWHSTFLQIEQRTSELYFVLYLYTLFSPFLDSIHVKRTYIM